MTCRLLKQHEILQEGDYCRYVGVSSTGKSYQWIPIAIGHPIIGYMVFIAQNEYELEFGRPVTLFPDRIVKL